MDQPSDIARYLAPTPFIDSEDPEIVAFAQRVIDGETDPTAMAVRLYYVVRDEVLYDPYRMGTDPHFYRASDCLREKRGFCIPKAALLAACGRAVGIPSRVYYADVRNHLSTPKLLELLGTDLFVWHGCTEFWLPDPATGKHRWVKATPAFNLSLCEKFGVHPLEFDGGEDSMFHEFDEAGRRHMEYVEHRGDFVDVPVDEIIADFDAIYPKLFETLAAGRGGDFAREAEET